MQGMFLDLKFAFPAQTPLAQMQSKHCLLSGEKNAASMDLVCKRSVLDNPASELANRPLQKSLFVDLGLLHARELEGYPATHLQPALRQPSNK